MKILQLISSAGFYGAESLVLSLSKALAALGHEVLLAPIWNRRNPNSDLAERAVEAGLSVQPVRSSGRMDPGTFSALRALTRSFAPDVIHCHGYKADIFAAVALASSQATLVSTCHNWTNKSAAVRTYARLDRLALRRFAFVICVSEPVLQILLRSGVRPHRAAVLPNGIDLKAFVDASPSLANIAGPGGAVVGMVGRLEREKGYHSVIEAASNILTQFPNTRFVVAGDGPERGNLMEQAEQSGVLDRFSFLGSRSDMPGIYRSLDAMVLPSLNEGMPMTVLEAMAAGVPVVATRVGALPQIIESGRNGLLLENGSPQCVSEALCHLLREPGVRLQMGQAAREWAVGHASIEHTARQYVRYYGTIPPAAQLAPR